MSANYQEITLNFNFWYVFIPIAMIIMVILGLRQYRRVDTDGYKKFYDEGTFSCVVYGLSFGFMVLLFVESLPASARLIGLLLSTNEAFMMYFLGSLMLIISAMLFGLFLYYVGVAAGYFKKGYLTNEIEEYAYYNGEKWSYESRVSDVYVSPRV